MKNTLLTKSVISLALLASAGCASSGGDGGKFRGSPNARMSAQSNEVISTTPRSFTPIPGVTKQSLDTLKEVIDLYRNRAALALQADQASLATNYVFRSASGASSQEETRLRRLRDYRDAGFDTAAIMCQHTLDILGEQQSDFRFGRDSIDLVSGFIATVLGLTRTNTQSMALFAAGDALFDSWSRNYEDYAYISASPRELSRLVREAQKTYKDSLKVASGDPQTFDQATLQIQTYNRYCLATGMRNLVDEAVRGAQVEWNPRSGAVQILGSASMDRFRTSSSLAAIQALYDRKEAVEIRLRAYEAELVGTIENIRRIEAQVAALGAGAEFDADRSRLAKDKTDAEAVKIRVESLISTLKKDVQDIETDIQAKLTELAAPPPR